MRYRTLSTQTKGGVNAPQYIYHVSPKKNRESILKSGIEPLHSRGRLRACWYVSRDRIEWALAHCSARHGVSVDKLDVYIVESAKIPVLRRNKHRGIYNSPCRVKPYQMCKATDMIEGEE